MDRRRNGGGVRINGTVMICSAVHGTVKSDNFLVIPKRPLVIINWPRCQFAAPVSDIFYSYSYSSSSSPFLSSARKFVWIVSRSLNSAHLAKAEIQRDTLNYWRGKRVIAANRFIRRHADRLFMAQPRLRSHGRASINRACPPFPV